MAARSTAWLAAFLGGAAGLALEVLWLAALGPALGHGRAAPFGVGAWIAGWAIGAAASARLAARGLHPARIVLAGGLLTSAAAATLLVALIRSPASLPAAAAIVGLVLTAGGQGLALPLLAAAGGLRAAWAASLAGAVLGARAAAWEAPAALGLAGAAFAAAAAALLAAGVAVLALRRPPTAAARGPASPTCPSEGRLRTLPAATPTEGIRFPAALLVGVFTAWLVIVQGVGLRLGALWLGGHQDTFALVLVASMGALALGAAGLAPLALRGRRGVAAIVALGLAGTVLVALGPTAWLGRGLGVDVIELARASPLALALALVGPALVPLGAFVPVLVRALAPPGAPATADGARMGALLLHEAWGGLAAACAFPWLLVPRVGLAGALGVALGAVAVATLAFTFWAPGGARGERPLAAVALAALLIGGWLLRVTSPALAAPALANPAFELRSFAEDEDYAVTVAHDGLRDERTLLTDGFRATATGDDYLYMRALGHVPVLLHPAPRRVGVLALGTGTTVGAVALHPEVERIDVFELSRAVVAAAPHFSDVNHDVLAEGLPGLLDDADGVARIVVHLGDGRRLLRELAQREGGALDVLTMEPLLPDAPFAVHLYTEGFYREARRALAPGGLVCQWVPPHALAPEVFAAVIEAFQRAHPWSAAFLCGSQLLLVGGEREPRLAPERFPGAAPWLSELGLEDPAGLAARLVAAPAALACAPNQGLGQGFAPGRAARPLTDADPWIVYRPRPRGVVALGYLPANLARLDAAAGPLPAQWADLVGEAGAERRAAVQRVHACRTAWGAYRAGLGGLRLPLAADVAEVDRLRRGLDGDPYEDDPEVRLLDRQVRFEHGTSQGLGALAQGDAQAALEHLTRAAAQRPRRADAHLYVAAAAARAGALDLAGKALARALELCPRALETRPGQRALQLGLAAALAEGGLIAPPQK